MVVFIYGGQPPGEWCLREESLPAGWTCIVCAAGSPLGGRALPCNFILAPADAYTPDLASPSLRLSLVDLLPSQSTLHVTSYEAACSHGPVYMYSLS